MKLSFQFSVLSFQVSGFRKFRFAFRSPDKRVARIRGMVAGEGRPRVRFAYPGYGF